MDYLFAPGEQMSTLLARLEENVWRGEIIGPHGSGKSTLVAGLIKALEASGFRCPLFGLHDGQRFMPRGWSRTLRRGGRPIVFIDGYEQLGWISRLAVRWRCARTGNGLVVTAHAPTGLPLLACTKPSVELTLEVARCLIRSGGAVADTDRWLVDAASAAFARHQGNVREVLFDLYDLYEQRKAHRVQATLSAR